MSFRIRQKRHLRQRAKEAKNPGITRYERYAHLAPFVAEAPDGAIPRIAEHAERSLCLSMLCSDGATRRYRFETRSARDRFVHVFQDRGARRA